MNVREGGVGSLHTLIINTSPEDPQRPIYVNVWQKQIWSRLQIQSNTGLEYDLYECWTEPKQGPESGVVLLCAAYVWRGRENPG
jgi:hypothetical protein